MNKKPLLHKFGRALLFAVLFASAGSVLATPTRGTQMNNYCARQPIQATAPQQSRPYQASGSSCLLCHTSANATSNNLNAIGVASATCSGSGTATNCGATMNPFCVATAPSNATITAPAAGTTVAQGQSLTYTAGNATNPDGFPLSHTWLFTGGMPNATGQSVSVPMSVAGSITTTLQVRNSVGMLATGTVPTRTVTVTGVAANQPPVATIGAPAGNVTIAQGGTVNFQGSGTDPDGNTPLTYSWNFGGGAANSTQQNPGAVTFNTAGTFTVTFTVTDSLGLSSTPVTRVVTVTGVVANQPPVATIGAPTGNVTVAQGGTVNFQGSGTDPNGNTPLTYSWNFGGGAANSTQQNPGAVTFNTAGTFTVTFTVTDSLGLSSTPVTRVVTVTGVVANQPPVATIGAPTGNVTVAQGGTVNFQGSGTDPNGNTPLTYSWNFGGGAANSTQQNPGAVTFNTAGTFTVTFTVTDSLGLSSTPVTRTVTVTATPPVTGAPVATIVAPTGNVTIARGGAVSFRGTGTAAGNGDDDEEDDDNGDSLRYNWNFGGGAPNSTRQNPGAVRFNTAGVFTVTLTVTDSRGRVSAPVTRIITVTAPANQPPVATIGAPTGNVTIVRGGTVTFSGSGSDPDGNLPLTYSWNFGGGAANSTQQNPGAVRFDTAGTFTVTFTVTDSLGLASAPVTRIITVTAPANQPPVASITAPDENVTIAQGGTVTFSGSGSDPDGNTPLTYSWDFGGGAANSTQQNPGAVRFDTAGTFTVTFTVTDSLGLASAPVTRTVTVTAAPQQPVAAIAVPAMNVSVLPGGSVTFRAANMGAGATYSWRFPGGTPSSSTRQNPGAVRFNSMGTYTVTLTVRSGGVSTMATRVITVAPSNQSPRIGDCLNGDDEHDDEHDD